MDQDRNLGSIHSGKPTFKFMEFVGGWAVWFMIVENGVELTQLFKWAGTDKISLRHGDHFGKCRIEIDNLQ